MKYIEVGTDDDPAPAAGDTTLNVAVESRATGAQSRVTVTTTNDTYQCVGTITATAPRAIVECGLFSAAAVGTMLARTTFAVINLAAADSIQVTWKITFSRA
jgi:F420-0:gamma-glutamyl ligase-like protein